MGKASVKNPYKTMFKGTDFVAKDKMHRPEGAGNFDNMDDYNIVNSFSTLEGIVKNLNVSNRLLLPDRKKIQWGTESSQVGEIYTSNNNLYVGKGDLGVDSNFQITHDHVIINPSIDFGTAGFVKNDSSGQITGGHGEKTTLNINRGSTSVDAYFQTTGQPHTATFGFVMNRPGSIVGLAVCGVSSILSVAGDVTIEVRKNDTPVFEVTTNVSGTGTIKWTGTQAAGIDTFVAGDIISAYIDYESTASITFTGLIGFIEIETI